MYGLLVRALLIQFLVSSLAAGGPAAVVSTRAALQFDVGGDVELTGSCEDRSLRHCASPISISPPAACGGPSPLIWR